jgi:hypothetical protein
MPCNQSRAAGRTWHAPARAASRRAPPSHHHGRRLPWALGYLNRHASLIHARARCRLPPARRGERASSPLRRRPCRTGSGPSGRLGTPLASPCVGERWPQRRPHTRRMCKPRSGSRLRRPRQALDPADGWERAGWAQLPPGKLSVGRDAWAGNPSPGVTVCAAAARLRAFAPSPCGPSVSRRHPGLERPLSGVDRHFLRYPIHRRFSKAQRGRGRRRGAVSRAWLPPGPISHAQSTGYDGFRASKIHQERARTYSHTHGLSAG